MTLGSKRRGSEIQDRKDSTILSPRGDTIISKVGFGGINLTLLDPTARAVTAYPYPRTGAHTHTHSHTIPRATTNPHNPRPPRRGNIRHLRVRAPAHAHAYHSRGVTQSSHTQNDPLTHHPPHPTRNPHPTRCGADVTSTQQMHMRARTHTHTYHMPQRHTTHNKRRTIKTHTHTHTHTNTPTHTHPRTHPGLPR